MNKKTRSDFIPLSVPSIGGNAWHYVKECLDTEWVSYVGSFVNRFERELARVTGANHAVAMNSGTSALHIGLLVVGIRANDEVIMPALSFVAPANAIRYVNAWPSFCDILAKDWQIDCLQLESFLRNGCERRGADLINLESGRRIGAIMPVHLLGGMADIDFIAELAEEFDLPIVEDAAEVLGATYKERPIGAPIPNRSHVRRVVCTSFNGNKIITTGGGGALLCEDRKIASQARHLSTTAKIGSVRFSHDKIGYNYRLTNLAAALGVAQLEFLPDNVNKKRAIASRYRESLLKVEGLACMPEPISQRSTFWMYTVKLPNKDAMPVVEALDKANIQARPLWDVLPQQRPFRNGSFVIGSRESEILRRRGISLPCSVNLEESDQIHVIEVLLQALVDLSV